MAGISSMFKAPKAPAPIAMPKPTPTPVMPAPMDKNSLEVRRASLAEERRRRGRSKTDLTEGPAANVDAGSGYDSAWLGE